MKPIVRGRSRVAMISTTTNGLITGFDMTAEQLLGYRSEEVIGRHSPVLFHDVKELQRRARLLSGGKGMSTQGDFNVIVAETRLVHPSEEEWTYVHRNGERIPVRVSVTALPDGDGAIAGFLLAAQDLRDSHQSAELVQRQATLLDLANDAILVRGLDHDTIMYWNQGAARLYGWSSEEAVGAYIHDFLRTVFPKPLEEVRKEFLATGFWQGELVHTTRQGRTITVSSRWTLLHDSRTVPTGSLELNTDITERKRAEGALKAAHEELERHVRERTADLVDANERLKVLSGRLIEIQELERRAIARDLHDEIGQALTAMKLNLRELQDLPDRTSVQAHIADSLEILDQVLHRVRSLALDLRPSLLDELGLVPALRWYAARQAERAGWQLEFSADGVTMRPSAEVEIACFRLTQEALTNVARHAHAGRIDVRLELKDHELTLIIRDDGIGFDPQEMRSGARAGMSIGLSGMEERVRLVGGQMVIQSAPAMGTEIRATFTLPPRPDDTKNAPT
ncbi:MAG: PAS domain S-box protein [Nitrospiraceae bacterium]